MTTAEIMLLAALVLVFALGAAVLVLTGRQDRR